VSPPHWPASPDCSSVSSSDNQYLIGPALRAVQLRLFGIGRRPPGADEAFVQARVVTADVRGSAQAMLALVVWRKASPVRAWPSCALDRPTAW